MGDSPAVIEVTPLPDLVRKPGAVLAEAREAAQALVDVVKQAGLARKFGGDKPHLFFEAWQTVGKFYGITARVVSTQFIQYGQIEGFEAHAVAVTRDGIEISAAEAACLTDESKWSFRTKYEWQGPYNARVKVAVGEERVPLFQLRSMAQTRACSKALRNVLAWVVVLAGFAPTPAEEMVDDAGDGGDHGSAGSAGAGQGSGGSKTDKVKSAVGGQKGGASGGSAGSGNGSGKVNPKVALAERLTAAAGGDNARYLMLLKAASKWTTGDGKDKWADDVNKMSEAWAGKSLPRLEEFLAKEKPADPAPEKTPAPEGDFVPEVIPAGCPESGPACERFNDQGLCEDTQQGCPHVG